jgi:hypothetical protein
MGREEEIQLLAYFVWEKEGCQDGHDVEHWQKAEVIWEEREERQKKSKPKFEVYLVESQDLRGILEDENMQGIPWLKGNEHQIQGLRVVPFYFPVEKREDVADFFVSKGIVAIPLLFDPSPLQEKAFERLCQNFYERHWQDEIEGLSKSLNLKRIWNRRAKNPLDRHIKDVIKRLEDYEREFPWIKNTYKNIRAETCYMSLEDVINEFREFLKIPTA